MCEKTKQLLREFKSTWFWPLRCKSFGRTCRWQALSVVSRPAPCLAKTHNKCRFRSYSTVWGHSRARVVSETSASLCVDPDRGLSCCQTLAPAPHRMSTCCLWNSLSTGWWCPLWKPTKIWNKKKYINKIDYWNTFFKSMCLSAPAASYL